MKNYLKYTRFPLGSIKAEGFLKEQMKIGKNGMAGNLYKLEPEMIEAPYLREFDVPALNKPMRLLLCYPISLKGYHLTSSRTNLYPLT